MAKLFLTLSIMIFIVEINNIQQLTSNYGFDISIFNSTTGKFTFTSNKIGYLGVGFGPSMRSTDMVIVRFQSQTNYVITDSFSTGYTRPSNDTALGGKSDYFNCNYTFSSGLYNLECLRLFDTGDSYDYIFKFPSSVDFIYAYGDSYGYHGANRAYFKMDLPKLPSTTNNSTSSVIVFSNISGQSIFVADFFNVKGIVLSIFWLGVNFLGVLIASSYRHLGNWVLFHRILSGGTALITVILGFISISLTTDSQKDRPTKAHRIIGIILIILCLIQLIWGNILYFLNVHPKMNNNLILKLKITHRFLGYISTILSFIQIGLGFGMRFSDSVAAVIVLTIMYSIFAIIWEITVFLKEKNKVLLVRELSRKKLKENLEEFNGKAWKKIKDDSKKVVLLDNFIVDVTDFFEKHPGGQIHLIESFNRDIGRYLDATASISTKFKPQNHLFSTYNHIFSKMIIGVIKDDHKLITIESKSERRSSKAGISEENKNYFDDFVSIASSKIIAKNTKQLRFQPKVDRSVKFSRFVPGYTSLGRHYSISSVKLNKSRYYSVCMCLEENIYERHLNLIHNLNLIEEQKSIIPVWIKEDEKYQDFLSLNVKKYEVNGLSQYLHSSEHQDDLIMKGPIGVGLDLDPNNLSGTYVAFSAGTGAFCFLDFVAFTLRYMVYQIGKKNNQAESNKIINEDFSNVSEDFKLIYLSSFADRESSVFIDFCEKMVELDKRYNLNVFSFHLRISVENNEKWNTEKIRSFISNEQNLKKCFLCGTQIFIDEINSSLLELGIPKENINLI